jgi:hypothetical protein
MQSRVENGRSWWQMGRCLGVLGFRGMGGQTFVARKRCVTALLQLAVSRVVIRKRNKVSCSCILFSRSAIINFTSTDFSLHLMNFSFCMSYLY